MTSSSPAPTVARTRFGLRKQAQLLLPLVGTWIAAFAVLGIAGTQQWAPLKQLFLDASYLGGQPWYSGILNEASIIAWSVAGTSALFGSWLSAHLGRPKAARFLLGGALVAAMLLLDVWIQFHSDVAPKLGIPKHICELGEASLGALWALTQWREIARTRWLVLLASGVALGVSAGVDVVFSPSGNTGLLLEDGNRLLGVLAFTHYMVLTTMDISRSVLSANAQRGQQSRPAAAPPAAPSNQVPAPRRGQPEPTQPTTPLAQR